MVFQTRHLFLHSAIDKEEISNELAVAEFVHHPFEEAAHEAGVLSHRVGLLRSFTELGGKGNSHGARRA